MGTQSVSTILAPVLVEAPVPASSVKATAALPVTDIPPSPSSPVSALPVLVKTTAASPTTHIAPLVAARPLVKSTPCSAGQSTSVSSSITLSGFTGTTASLGQLMGPPTFTKSMKSTSKRNLSHAEPARQSSHRLTTSSTLSGGAKPTTLTKKRKVSRPEPRELPVFRSSGWGVQGVGKMGSGMMKK